MKEIIKFIDSEIEILPEIQDETIWGTQKQLCELFER
jgi:hypothetical protein